MAVKVFMMARVVKVVQTVLVVPMVQVIRLVRVVHVVRWLGGHVVRVVRVATLDDMLRSDICHEYHKLYSWRKICHVEKFQLSMYINCGEIENFSTCGEISDVSA